MPTGGRGDAVSGAEGRLCAGVFVLVGMGLGAPIVTAAGGGVSVDEQAATTIKIIAKQTWNRTRILVMAVVYFTTFIYHNCSISPIQLKWSMLQTLRNPSRSYIR